VDGPNALPRPDKRGLVEIFFSVLQEPMFALLLVGGAVYLALGEPTEAAVLIVFAGLSVTIAVIQEYRSERVLDALKGLTASVSTVIRSGERRRVPSRELVRGDVVAIAEGDRVPADAILRQGDEVEVDESLLTGESIPVGKVPAAGRAAPTTPGGEDTPFVYSGALIVRGQGLAEVTATGPRTELGRIGQSLQSIASQPSRLTLETRRIVRLVGLVAFIVCASVVLIIGASGGGWLAGLLAGVALGMALLPEEFPLVLTVFTVMGAWRIAKAKVLTRTASSIQALGAATVLCTDKTGTLTENRMSLVAAWSGGEVVRWAAGAAPPAAARALAQTCLLASAPHPFDPMELAFHSACRGWFSQPEPTALLRTYGVSRERMAVIQAWAQPLSEIRLVAAKGAPETIAALCRLSPSETTSAMEAVENLAAGGVRVLGVAEVRVEDSWTPDTLQTPMAFLGLVGLVDPLRADVARAVAECGSAGVRVAMITGDYPATAKAIALEAGLPPGETLSGADLAALSASDLATRVGSISVFARILPEQKLRIVEALKSRGEIVAMTGDGVNDAPALKAADIGIAMGRRGVDVAREASDLVLLEDDFGSIVATMRLGRRIYDNLQKAMGFILAVHVPIAGAALLPLLLGLPPFLAPAHIAFLEMVIDPACSLAFEAEPEEAGVMQRPPRSAHEPLFTGTRLALSLFQGAVALTAVCAVYALSLAWGRPPDQVRTIAYISLVLSTVALIEASRSFSGVSRPNAALGWILLGVTVALGLVIWAPAVRDLFGFGLLDLSGLGLAFAGALVCYATLLAAKLVSARRKTQSRSFA
jgi:Ca2+-transporting ATPase